MQVLRESSGLRLDQALLDVAAALLVIAQHYDDPGQYFAFLFTPLLSPKSVDARRAGDILRSWEKL